MEIKNCKKKYKSIGIEKKLRELQKRIKKSTKRLKNNKN